MNYLSILRSFNENGYSDASAKYVDNGKGGQVLKLTSGDYTYEDEFYGGEPFSGNETIWKGEKPVFRIVYHGATKGAPKLADLYNFLKEALSQNAAETSLHRGPRQYTKGDWLYENASIGTEDLLTVEEKIFFKGEPVYKSVFRGGLINK
jgi:hypothetical protein